MTFCKSILSILLLLVCGNMTAQSLVEILNADSTHYNKNDETYRLFGNVRLKQDGIFINCDKAIRHNDKNQVEASGNIIINQPDTFTLTGDDLKYDGNTKLARITGNVVLRDQEMTLTTNALEYNTATQTGYYTTGGNIVSSSNTLKSQRGTYNRRGSTFYFKQNVVLTSPEYTMESDTFQYNTVTKTAYFFGPTKIKSDENVIVCNSGWYNTKTERSQFAHSATIYSKENRITADSILYDRKAGLGRAYGNIELVDTLEKTNVYGQYGLYNQKTKTTLVTKNPMAVRLLDEDSLYLAADSFYYFSDSLQRKLKTYHHAKIWKNDFQGVCDSLIYNFSDSVIRMYYAPILWNGNNQITGDTVFIYMKHNKINFMKVDGNAFIASLVQGTRFNQIAGKTMDNYFEDNKLKRVHVTGNGESIYYAREDESDTGAYVGVNHIVCSEMMIFLDSNKVDNIRFYTKPEGTLFPPNQFPEEESKLKGFTWREAQKPTAGVFLERMQRVVAIPEPVKPKPAKIVKKPKPAAKKKEPGKTP